MTHHNSKGCISSDSQGTTPEAKKKKSMDFAKVMILVNTLSNVVFTLSDVTVSLKYNVLQIQSKIITKNTKIYLIITGNNCNNLRSSS